MVEKQIHNGVMSTPVPPLCYLTGLTHRNSRWGRPHCARRSLAPDGTPGRPAPATGRGGGVKGGGRLVGTSPVSRRLQVRASDAGFVPLPYPVFHDGGKTNTTHPDVSLLALA